MESNDFGRLIPKKFVPCFEGCTYNTTLPVPKKLDSCKSLHSNQQLMWAKDKIVDDSKLNEESSNGDMELDSQPNKGEDFPDQKKSSLRSWKRILRSSNNQAATEVSPKLPCLSKCTPSKHSSLDSHTHKKQLLSKKSLNILHTTGGGTPSPLPPP